LPTAVTCGTLAACLEVHPSDVSSCCVDPSGCQCCSDAKAAREADMGRCAPTPTTAAPPPAPPVATLK
jgi:hypothetical protein